MTKSQIFMSAWTVARANRAAHATMRAAFSAALKQTYATLKAPRRPALTIKSFHAHGGRAWIARITGRDAKFGLSRAFLGKRDVTNSGNTYRQIEIVVALEAGAVYEWSSQESARRAERGFWIVRGDALHVISRADILTIMA